MKFLIFQGFIAIMLVAVCGCRARPHGKATDKPVRVHEDIPELSCDEKDVASFCWEKGYKQDSDFNKTHVVARYIGNEDLGNIVNMKSITHLDISYSRRLSFDLVDSIWKMPNICSVMMSHCDDLQDAAFKSAGNCATLRELDVSDCSMLTGRKWLGGIAGCIEVFRADDCVLLSESPLLSLTRGDSIKELVLSNCIDFTDRCLAELGNSVILETLELRNLVSVTDKGIEKLCGLSTLRTLTLWAVGKLTKRFIQSVSKLPNLKDVCFRGYAIDDVDIDSISNNLNIESINVIRCLKVTISGIRSMLKYGPTRTLRVSTGVLFSDDDIKKLRLEYPDADIFYFEVD